MKKANETKKLTDHINPLHRHWKKHQPFYAPIHDWVRRNYGKASKCENKKCGHPNPKRFEWANISGKYKKDISDFKQLCVSCHRRMDKGKYCKRDHKFTKKNTWIHKKGWRICRICNNLRVRKWLANNK